MNTVRFLRIFFAFLGTPCWYEGIDKPTTWQRLWGWRIGPVLSEGIDGGADAVNDCLCRECDSGYMG